MPDKPYVLAIDSGTEAVRAIVFDHNGGMVAREAARHEPCFSREPGWFEQDPRDYWDKLCLVTRRLMARPEFDPGELAACAITAQRASVIFAGAAGDPVRPCITWLDRREVDRTPGPPGPPDPVDLYARFSKMNWVKANEPDVYARVARFLSVAGWFTWKLTGRVADSTGMQVGAWPFDMAALDWYDLAPVFEAVGCRPEQMAELFRPGEVMGTVTPRAAEETGLPEGLPVVASAGDRQCETLGSGCTGHGTAAVSHGTAAVVGTTSRTYLASPTLEYYTWPSAVPGAWNPEFFLFRGFWLMGWFRRQFGRMPGPFGSAAGAAIVDGEALPDEEILEREASRLAPGSDGLVVHPYWTPRPVLTPTARGAVLGWTDAHTRVHLYRAILEGVAFALKDGVHLLERDLGARMTQVKVSGGGARSDLAMQVTADVFNLPVGRPSTVETCALGAAINAAMAAGWCRDADEGAAGMTKVDKVFRPDERNMAIYQELYEGVHRRLGPVLEELHQTLGRVSR